MIRGHAAVREALRNTDFYSSDLQGDADVRDYRQLPLEVDPPIHHAYRAALSPLFVKPKIESLAPQFADIASELIHSFEKRGGGNFLDDIALRYVVTCLGVIFDRPQDVDEWISWGAGVWDTETGERSGANLHGYLERVFEESAHSNANDVWTFVRAIEINGKPLTFEQFKGIGSVCLAGGRDTVVKLISGSVWHLLQDHNNLELLQSKEVQIREAIPELLRYLTPLPGMLRVTPDQQPLEDSARAPEQFTEISFASANFDETVFSHPDTIDLKRGRVPHMAFGFGPHTCIGNAIAEIETEVILTQLLDKLPQWKFASEPEIQWLSVGQYQFPGHFASLNIKC